MENKSESIKELLTALSKAQGEMGDAVKGSDNPFFHSTYADLASVWEVARGPLSRNGLAIVQIPEITENGFVLNTMLGHNSGEFIVSRYPITPMKQMRDSGWTISNDPQSIGSAISYAKRYALAAMLGIATADEDDDGEKAMGRGKDVQKPVSKITKPPFTKKPIDVVKEPITMVKDDKVEPSEFPPSMTPAEIAVLFPGSEVVQPPDEALPRNTDEIYAELYSELNAVAGTKSKLKARLWWSQNVNRIVRVSDEQKKVLRDFVNSVGKK